MIDILDTLQDVGETIDEDAPLIDDTKADIISMRQDLRELGYTRNEIEELMSPYEFGHQINIESIRKLNRHVRRIKNLHKRILLASGFKGTPDGITARESIQSNLTLQQIHSELVYDRMLREKKERTEKNQDLKAKIEEEKSLRSELAANDMDSKKLFGYTFSPFKIEKGKLANFE
jgi:DNA-binding transcriptional MerR regulator